MFNLKSASPEIREITRMAGIKNGKYEPVNAGDVPSELVRRGLGNTPIARVWGAGKSIEITADDIVIDTQHL